MCARSKAKGIRGELEAAGEVRRLFGCSARRGQQFCGGHDSPDVVTDIPGVHIEVKRRERFRIMDAVNQAIRDAAGKIPVVLYRSNGNPWLAIVPLDQLPALATNLYLQLASGEAA